MPIEIEHCDGGVIFKYKLDEYYNQNLNPFLQCVINSGLLSRCSLATSMNESYYNLAFQAKSVSTLKTFLLSHLSNGYESDSSTDSLSFSSSSSSSYSSYSSDEEGVKRGLGGLVGGLVGGFTDDYISDGNLFSYNQSLMLIGCLTTQLSTLRRNRLSFIQLDLDGIFVIDGSIFIVLDPEMVTSIGISGMMTFLEPVAVRETSFCCPEIEGRTVVPFNCHCNCVYHSFASLIYYCMFNDYLPMVNCKKNRCILEGLKYVHLLDANTEDILSGGNSGSGSDSDCDSINFEMVNEAPMTSGATNDTTSGATNDTTSKEADGQLCFDSQCVKIDRLNGTKMYYFLKRCLEPKGDRRKLFYI
jgi:hypothetical protein